MQTLPIVKKPFRVAYRSGQALAEARNRLTIRLLQDRKVPKHFIRRFHHRRRSQLLRREHAIKDCPNCLAILLRESGRPWILRSPVYWEIAQGFDDNEMAIATRRGGHIIGYLPQRPMYRGEA
jgi:hypothetical protein